MAKRFCSNCGTALRDGAQFCVGCGQAIGGGASAAGAGIGASLQRYAPVLVVSIVLVLGAVIVVIGMQSPKMAPRVPGGSPPQAGGLPPDHPPLGVPEEVKQSIRQLVAEAEAAPDDLERWKRLGDVQYRAGQLEPSYGAAAEKSYAHVLERAPNDPDALRALGNLAYDRKQPKKAIDYYKQYLEQRPDDLNVRTDMGTMHLALGDDAEAVRVFEGVLKEDPKFFQAQFNLAIAYHSSGRTEDAVAALEKARDVAPDERSRGQVEQLIARAQRDAAEAGGGETAPAAPREPEIVRAEAAPAGPGLQSDVEDVFRSNPVMGPKVEKFEWTGEATARAYLRDFPMDSMGDDMRTMFLDRMNGRIREKKAAHQFDGRVQVEIVDVASGTVMGAVAD